MRSDDFVSAVRPAANAAHALWCSGNSWAACLNVCTMRVKEVQRAACNKNIRSILATRRFLGTSRTTTSVTRILRQTLHLCQPVLVRSWAEIWFDHEHPSFDRFYVGCRTVFVGHVNSPEIFEHVAKYFSSIHQTTKPTLHHAQTSHSTCAPPTMLGTALESATTSSTF